jgi:hypothetical protein
MSMKVFVARIPDPSAKPAVHDVHQALEGELVTMQLQPSEHPGSERTWCMAGLGSARATTCFTVAELDMSFTEYVDVLRDGYRRQGRWVGPADDAWLLDAARVHALSAAPYAVGTPLHVGDGKIIVRPGVP